MARVIFKKRNSNFSHDDTKILLKTQLFQMPSLLRFHEILKKQTRKSLKLSKFFMKKIVHRNKSASSGRISTHFKFSNQLI